MNSTCTQRNPQAVSCTYHSLGQTGLVGGWLGGGLVGTPRVTQDGELLHSLDTALSQTPDLYPVGAHGLVGVDHEVVSLS